jgi:hypothetical protein
LSSTKTTSFDAHLSLTMMIERPSATDILCGQDKKYAKHAGNVVYRNMIQARAADYATASTKQDKMRMTTKIVSELLSLHGSRFLKCSLNGGWEELSAAAARDKTSHALRFCAAKSAAMKSSNTVTIRGSSRSTSPVTATRRPSKVAAAAKTSGKRHRRTVSWETNSSAFALANAGPSDQHAAPYGNERSTYTVIHNLSHCADNEPIAFTVSPNEELDAMMSYPLQWEDVNEEVFFSCDESDC